MPRKKNRCDASYFEIWPDNVNYSFSEKDSLWFKNNTYDKEYSKQVHIKLTTGWDQWEFLIEVWFFLSPCRL